MRIKIKSPTKEGIAFAKEYIAQERDEIPYHGPLTRVVEPFFLRDLRNGNLDDIDYDIDLHPFKWENYLIIERYLKLHVPGYLEKPFTGSGGKKTTRRSGGKKRRVRVRRTHRRRA